eukprot:9785766-Alexandrium_andersonii.AAC.1
MRPLPTNRRHRRLLTQLSPTKSYLSPHATAKAPTPLSNLDSPSQPRRTRPRLLQTSPNPPAVRRRTPDQHPIANDIITAHSPLSYPENSRQCNSRDCAQGHAKTMPLDTNQAHPAPLCAQCTT